MEENEFHVHTKGSKSAFLGDGDIQSLKEGLEIAGHIEEILNKPDFENRFLNNNIEKIKKANIDLKALDLKAPVLDVGGTGEYVIYKNSECTLDIVDCDCDNEISEAGMKVYDMDCTNLLFSDESYKYVTFFYTIMYMPYDVICKGLKEVYRVMKKDGTLLIWDILNNCQTDGHISAPVYVTGRHRSMKMTYCTDTVHEIRDYSFYKKLLNMSGFMIKYSRQKDNSIFIEAGIQ